MKIKCRLYEHLCVLCDGVYIIIFVTLSCVCARCGADHIRDGMGAGVRALFTYKCAHAATDNANQRIFIMRQCLRVPARQCRANVSTCLHFLLSVHERLAIKHARASIYVYIYLLICIISAYIPTLIRHSCKMHILYFIVYICTFYARILCNLHEIICVFTYLYT